MPEQHPARRRRRGRRRKGWVVQWEEGQEVKEGKRGARSSCISLLMPVRSESNGPINTCPMKTH